MRVRSHCWKTQPGVTSRQGNGQHKTPLCAAAFLESLRKPAPEITCQMPLLCVYHWILWPLLCWQWEIIIIRWTHSGFIPVPWGDMDMQTLPVKSKERVARVGTQRCQPQQPYEHILNSLRNQSAVFKNITAHLRRIQIVKKMKKIR